MLVNKAEHRPIQPVQIFNQRSTKAGSEAGDELKVDGNLGELATQALAAGDDTAAVEEARKLIASGQLDTPDAALAAAKKMVELGI